MNILFDIGKTKMRFAKYDGGDTFEEPLIVPTPEDFEEFIKIFKESVERVATGEQIEAGIGGIGAPLNPEKTETIGVRWVKEPLKKRLEEVIGASVYLENDATMAGLGESTYGAGKEEEIVAYLTVSTGVGGVRIVNNEIDEVSIGFEPGHEIIDPDKSMCPDCPGNTLEKYISGSAIEKRFGKKSYDIPQSSETWKELAQFLAYGLNNLIVYWSPDVIVLGGSMITGDPAIQIEEVRKNLKKILKIFPTIPDIKMAKLGDIGGLYGAMAYLKQKGIK